MKIQYIFSKKELKQYGRDLMGCEFDEIEDSDYNEFIKDYEPELFAIIDNEQCVQQEIVCRD